MGFLGRFLKKDVKVESRSGSIQELPGDAAKCISPDAQELVAEALRIIDTRVEIGRGTFTVCGAGSEGEVMQAARKLQQAHELQPKNCLLHYAYVCALDIAAQGKSATEEMTRLADSNPSFLLAKLAVARGERTQKYPLFILPSWHPARVHPVISSSVKTFVFLAVRKGIEPRVAFFLRDSEENFRHVEASRIRIDITNMMSSVGLSQMVAGYARIWDNPRNPLQLETFDFPFGPAESAGRLIYELLCLQNDVDFVVINSSDQILLNRRLSIPPMMRETNRQVLNRLIEAPDGPRFSDAEKYNAITEHQRRTPLSAVRY
jgi:hypothetical protein